jgi:protein-L-isoaspartate(D-aspartate) O-methyltransferase
VDDTRAYREALVDTLVRDGAIRTARVEAAFRAVPRHRFVDRSPETAYRNQVIPTRVVDGVPVSSASQPTIMAIMLEQLGLEPGQRVLEIGTGTGYNAALLAHIVGREGEVVSIEIDADLAAEARGRLAAIDSPATVLAGDGGFGWSARAPYDRIILTAAAWDLASAWREQLAPAGRLVLPLSLGAAVRSVAFERAGDHLASLSIHDCDFVWLRGALSGPGERRPLGREPGLSIWFADGAPPDADTAHDLLAPPLRTSPTTVSVTAREIWSGLMLWLALEKAVVCELFAIGPLADSGRVPYLFGVAGSFCRTVGLFEDGRLCVLSRAPERALPETPPPAATPFELHLRGAGPDDRLAHRLLGRIVAWDAAGRPSTRGARIRAWPIDAAPALDPAARELVKRWTRLAIDWPAPDAAAAGT